MNENRTPHNLLGFDYGTRRIGVAVGNTLTRTARGLATIRNEPKPDWNSIQSLFNEWKPEACIVGLPLNMDGSEQPLTGLARRFASELESRYSQPVHTMDERLSTVEARASLKSQRVQGRKKRIQPGEKDTEAARIILENWLDMMS